MRPFMTLTRAVHSGLQTVAGAQRRLLDGIVALPSEDVGLDAVVGRILAQTVRSSWELPGFDNSAMDGYAVRAADVMAATRAAPVALPVSGESRAGGAPPQLRQGTAIRIMTGAPLPEGADAVVRQEESRRNHDGVLIEVAVAAGTNVRRRGADMAAGTPVLRAGRVLTSVDVGIGAALGYAGLAVHRRPTVAVLASGDELVAAGSPRGPSQVTDSNSPMVAAAVHEAGGTPRFLGVARDTPGSVRTLIDAAAGCDVIVSTAGVSVGDHDHVREVVVELGEIDTWRIAMRPGKPMLIGHVRGAIFLGLPGNPVSSSVTFELFARPAIRALQGELEPHRGRISVRLGETMDKPMGVETYTRAVLRPGDDGVPVASSAGDQGSSMLRSLAAADCLLVLASETASFPAGTVVEAIPLR
jgi:molybdopterin molybdotransferase